MDNNKERKFKIIAVTMSVLSGLLILEISARILIPRPIFNPRIVLSSSALRTFDGTALWSIPVNTHIDSASLEKLKTSQTGRFLITGVGDSIMNGAGISPGDTYMASLASAIRSRAGVEPTVIDLSMSGFNFVQESAAFRETAPPLCPNLLIVHSWEDDTAIFKIVGGIVFDARETAGGAPRLLPLSPRANGFLLRNLRIYQFANLQFLRKRYAREKVKLDNSELISAADKLARACGDKTKILFLFSPKLDAGPIRPAIQSVPNQDVYATLGGWAAKNHADVLDLGAVLNGVDGKSVGLDVCHFNEKGHRMILDILAEYISKRYTPPAPKARTRKS